MRDGLGAASVVSDARVPSFLSECFDVLSVKFCFDWKDGFDAFPAELSGTFELPFIIKAANQSRTGSFNFHHGALYLCDAKRVAQTYAGDIPEVVRFGFALHDLLESYSIHEEVSNHAFVRTLLPIRNAIESSAPLILKVSDFDLAALFTEHGEPVVELRPPVEYRPTSYEYRSVLPASALTVL